MRLAELCGGCDQPHRKEHNDWFQGDPCESERADRLRAVSMSDSRAASIDRSLKALACCIVVHQAPLSLREDHLKLSEGR